MPIPQPNKNEDKNKFISRCMQNPIMLKDYPDNKQRAAVCYNSFKEHKRNKGAIQRFIEWLNK